MPRNLFITLRNASMVRTTIGHHVNLNMKRRELPSHVRVVHKSDGCSDYIVSVLINLQGYNKCRSIRFQVGVVVVLPRQIKSPWLKEYYYPPPQQSVTSLNCFYQLFRQFSINKSNTNREPFYPYKELSRPVGRIVLWTGTFWRHPQYSRCHREIIA